MKSTWLRRVSQAPPHHAGLRRRFISSSAGRHAVSHGSSTGEAGLSRTRNIGIIAHIDAGKTTTTERMLYYSGFTRRIGDVDEGSTVTDFLPAERARGITIQSAAISFDWPPAPATQNQLPGTRATSTASQSCSSIAVPRSSVPHNINLIDTPGHADFTFEVLRSLRVLDGAVCIIDGVAGVEAQTEQVWNQANRYQIPRIVYINKLDRDGAAFGRSVREVAIRLHGFPAVCQIPWWKHTDGNLVGIGDVVGLRGLLWDGRGDGKAVTMLALGDLRSDDQVFADELSKARVALVELLSEHDEEMIEKFLEYNEDHLAIPSQDVTDSLRRCVMQSSQKVIPIFAGASFRNIGVQPLLDAVVDLLPSPDERPEAEVEIGNQNTGLHQLLDGRLPPMLALTNNRGKGNKATTATKATNVLTQNLQACALAFKVVSDPRRGVLVYVRVYSGTITRMAALYNTNLNITEKAPRLLKMYASDSVDVDSITAGQIGVIAGLKFTRTGDTLINYSGANPKVGPPFPISTLQLRPIAVPPPVFFTSVEARSLSEEKVLAEKLALLLREDPSLNVRQDEESGQTLLSGMGELHLEIAQNRLVHDFSTKATVGKIDIGYRETISAVSELCTEHVNRELAGKKTRASCAASVSPMRDSPQSDQAPEHFVIEVESNRLIVRHPNLDDAGNTSSPDGKPLPAHLSMTSVLSAIQAGVSAALSRGPLYSFPLHSVHVEVHLDPILHIFPETTTAAISNAARQAVQAALRSVALQDGSVLMEPVMLASITVNESNMGNVVHDINSARGGQIISLDASETSVASGAVRVGTNDEDDSIVIDLKRIYTPPDPFDRVEHVGTGLHSAAGDKQRQITARIPLKEMVGYLKHLRSLTGGRGTFVMTIDRFERMNGSRQKTVLAELRGSVG